MPPRLRRHALVLRTEPLRVSAFGFDRWRGKRDGAVSVPQHAQSGNPFCPARRLIREHVVNRRDFGADLKHIHSPLIGSLDRCRERRPRFRHSVLAGFEGDLIFEMRLMLNFPSVGPAISILREAFYGVGLVRTPKSAKTRNGEAGEIVVRSIAHDLSRLSRTTRERWCDRSLTQRVESFPFRSHFLSLHHVVVPSKSGWNQPSGRGSAW